MPSKIAEGSFIYCFRKIFRKTNISYPPIRTHMYAYQGVRNISFSENFANVLNEWSLSVREIEFCNTRLQILKIRNMDFVTS